MANQSEWNPTKKRHSFKVATNGWNTKSFLSFLAIFVCDCELGWFQSLIHFPVLAVFSILNRRTFMCLSAGNVTVKKIMDQPRAYRTGALKPSAIFMFHPF